MTVRNFSWYNLNEQRPWPIDDKSSAVDVKGQRLPNDMLSDLTARWPSELAERAFLAAFTVSRGLVTLVISLDNEDKTPILSCSYRKPVEPGIQYDLESLVPGAYGRVVFGSGVARVTSTTSYSFADPAKSLLLAATARPYTLSRLASIGVLGVEKRLIGLVRLRGDNDIETLSDTRVIAGKPTRVGVIRLKNKSQSGVSTSSLYEKYAGDCGRRPESKNCLNGVPIESINEVQPDCCGRIFIELRGGLDGFGIENLNGVALDYPLNLADACLPDDGLPDDRGRLPNEYEDACNPANLPAEDVQIFAAEVRGIGTSPATEVFQSDALTGNWLAAMRTTPGLGYGGLVAGAINHFGKLAIGTPVPHGLIGGESVTVLPSGEHGPAEVLDSRTFKLDAPYVHGAQCWVRSDAAWMRADNAGVGQVRLGARVNAGDYLLVEAESRYWITRVSSTRNDIVALDANILGAKRATVLPATYASEYVSTKESRCGARFELDSIPFNADLDFRFTSISEGNAELSLTFGATATSHYELRLDLARRKSLRLLHIVDGKTAQQGYRALPKHGPYERYRLGLRVEPAETGWYVSAMLESRDSHEVIALQPVPVQRIAAPGLFLEVNKSVAVLSALDIVEG